MSVSIVTDSTADIPLALLKEFGVHVVPLKVIFGEEEFIDGVTMTAEEFYPRLETDETFPTTSQPSPGEFMEKYRELGDSDGIVSIHISSELSGTYGSAAEAVSQLGGEGPEIRVIDSRSASMGIGLIVLEAAKAAKDGADVETIVGIVEGMIPRTGVVFLLDSLEYLRRGGRIGMASAFLGSLLRFQPLLILDEGIVKPLSRPRSRRRGIEQMRAYLQSQGELAGASVIAANDLEGARQLAGMIEDLVPGEVTATSIVGPVIGAHAGPGLIGVAFAAAPS